MEKNKNKPIGMTVIPVTIPLNALGKLTTVLMLLPLDHPLVVEYEQRQAFLKREELRAKTVYAGKIELPAKKR